MCVLRVLLCDGHWQVGMMVIMAMVLHLHDNVSKLRERVEFLPDALVSLLQVICRKHLATAYLTQKGVEVTQVLVVEKLVDF